MRTVIAENTVIADYWHALDERTIQCDLCPRFCHIHPGQHGLCFVRQNIDQQLALNSYGRSSGFVIDPIEKKPLNHFYPGTPILSFGTAGCNLACKFCQNWDISKSRELHTLSSHASPQAIAQAAGAHGCNSVAYTYNDPVVFHEYAIDTAQACRELGIHSVAVTAGYVCDAPREEFYRHMDAANVDLKAFSESFYRNVAGGHLQPVLETLLYLKHQTSVWLEITTLLIPGENDSTAELQALTQWVVDNLGCDVPIHFTAFHPDWKMTNKPPTPAGILLNARKIALANGVRYAYVGNVHNKQASSSYCHACGQLLIGRDWHQLSEWRLDANGCCQNCGAAFAGRFNPQPGTWGAKRQALTFG